MGRSEHLKADGFLDPAATPEAIEARSFAIIDAEVTVKPFSGLAWEVARRLVHTSGDISLLSSLCLPEEAILKGAEAIRKGCPVFTDTEMARAGITMRRLERFGCAVSCVLARQGLAETSARKGITRTRAGIEALGGDMKDAILAIGNAPTALLALLAHVASGGPAPALVIGMPVGFVNAEESKELLLQTPSLASLVIRGRRGGSPLAAAAVNALAIIAARDAVSR